MRARPADVADAFVAARRAQREWATWPVARRLKVIRRFHRLLIEHNDVVVDLGSGDGRLVVTAAKKFGAHGIGIDIDPARIAEGNANAAKAGVTHLVEFRQQDALEADLSKATVVTLYLLSSSNVKLRPRLLSQLKPGARIVSHQFGMGDWQPDKVDTFTDANGTSRTLYLWTVGANSPKSE